MKFAFFPFFQDDWLRDTRALSESARGVWIDLICLMWQGSTDTVTESVTAIARILSQTQSVTESAIAELGARKVAEVTKNADGTVSIRCRRTAKDMQRAETEILSRREKTAKARAVKASRRSVTETVTEAVTDSVTTSISKDPNIRISKDPNIQKSERDAEGHPRTVHQPEAPKTDSLLPAGAGVPLKIQESEKREPQAQESKPREIEEWRMNLLMKASATGIKWNVRKDAAVRWVASLKEPPNPPDQWECEFAIFAYA